MQGQTSEPEDFRVATISAHYLMSRSLTQTRNPTDGHPWSHASDARKMQRNESMNNASLKWSTAHLCPWSSPPQAEWGTWCPHSTRDWLHFCQRRDMQEVYSSTLGWIRTHLSFSLLRSAIMCIRGAQSSSKHVVKGCDSCDLVTAEAHIRE